METVEVSHLVISALPFAPAGMTTSYNALNENDKTLGEDHG